MTSVIYATLSAFLIGWLSLNVIKLRRKNKISIGDGEIGELKTAIAAHSNAIEYIPIALILLFALEYNKGPLLLVHVLGLALIIGRIIHAKSILSGNLPKRVFGMHVTFYTIACLSICNLIYLPYKNLFNL